MELDAQNILGTDDGTKIFAIVRRSPDVFRFCAYKTVGMNEIKVRVLGKSAEDGVAGTKACGVPSRVGNVQAG